MSIILQQLKLHFGEEFDTLYANTRSYVKGLISKPWWTDRKALIESEGPLSRMVEDCLAHVVDKGEKIDGWRAYTSYLSNLYGSNKAENQTIGEVYPSEETSVLWSTLGESLDNYSQSLLGDNVVVEEQMRSAIPGQLPLFNEEKDSYILFDANQAEFIEVYHKMGVDAAAKEFNLTPKQARTRRNSIKKTITHRIESNQVDFIETYDSLGAKVAADKFDITPERAKQRRNAIGSR